MTKPLYTWTPQALSAALGLNGATLTSYLAGTTTPANLYSDSALSTSVGNVLTADSLGIFPNVFGGSDVSYKFVLAHADIPTKTYDNASLADALSIQQVVARVTSIAELRNKTWTGTSVPSIVNVEYNHSPGDGGGTFTLKDGDEISPDDGGVIIADMTDKRWQRQYAGAINVTWFGATGDGITPDQTPIQTAINFAFGWSLATGTTQTTGFTATAGYLYPCNTTSAAFTVTLPASPAQGDRVGFYDSNNTFDTNNLTVARNGNNLLGAAANQTVSTEGKYFVVEYDESIGWFYAPNGGEVCFPRGTYAVSSAITVDQSVLTGDAETGRITLRGEGDGNTHIYSTHSGRTLSFQGDAGNALGGYLTIDGIRFRGSGIAGSTHLWMDNLAWFQVANCTFIDADYGVDGTDVLSGVFDTCRIRFNNDGYRFRFSDVSRPNAITMRDCIVGSNYKRGGTIEGGASVNIRGGSVEGNGVTGVTPFAGGYGIKATDCGVEGVTGLVIDGVYFEANADTADVWIVHTTGDVVHRISGCSFARIFSTHYVTNNIKFTRSGGSSVVWLGGNGFKALNTYSESAARRYVDATAGTIIEAGNFYASSTATSVKSQIAGFNRPGMIYGLTMSNGSVDPTNDITILAGQAIDQFNTEVMELPSSITKRLDASWAVGTDQGGLDTGSIANDTYHVHLIKRYDTGVVDVLFSTSPTSPTLPSGYNYSRRIGSIVRASGAILTFTQRGDQFLLKTVNTSFTALNNPGTSAQTATITNVPTDIQVNALLTVGLTDNSPDTDTILTVTSLDQDDVAAATTNGTIYSDGTGLLAGGVNQIVYYQDVEVRTNTSAQIRLRLGNSDADIFVSSRTRGWIDARGKDAVNT